MKYRVAFNTTQVVDASIREVLITLAEAIALVVLVMFLFLQNWRTTLIPTITIPVSLVGAFAFVKLMDFSINTLTLFGIILATGIVVDDAIVVIENIERHIQEYKKPARQAASDAMREVFGAVIATALVLIAVFVPVAFFPGTTGRLYAQFSITIAFSVALSAFNAITLTPALSALLLDRSQHGKNIFFRAVERVITAGTNLYIAALGRLMPVRWAVVLVFIARPCRHLRDVPHRAAGARARRGPRLLHHRRPGAGRFVAAAHREHREAGGADPAEGSRHRGRLLGDGLQLQRCGTEPGTDLQRAETVRRTTGRRPRTQGRPRPPARTALQHRRGAGDPVCAGADSRAGRVRRVRIPGPRSIWSRYRRTGQRDLRDGRSGKPEPAAPGLVEHVYGERSAVVRRDRSRARAGAGAADRRGHQRAADLPRIAVRQRLRLQQPRVPRVRPGRQGIPVGSQGAQAALRAHDRRATCCRSRTSSA